MFADYIQSINDTERSSAIRKILDLLQEHLPPGFEAQFQYRMPSYVVPLSLYPQGYLGNTTVSLPFISLANQKNHLSIYHMGLYANPSILDWFVEQFPLHSKTRLDMGKGCIRFKRMEDIPFDLLAELFRKISVQDWISTYTENLQKK
jgi:hypothetical protein